MVQGSFGVHKLFNEPVTSQMGDYEGKGFVAAGNQAAYDHMMRALDAQYQAHLRTIKAPSLRRRAGRKNKQMYIEIKGNAAQYLALVRRRNPIFLKRILKDAAEHGLRVAEDTYFDKLKGTGTYGPGPLQDTSDVLSLLEARTAIDPGTSTYHISIGPREFSPKFWANELGLFKKG